MKISYTTILPLLLVSLCFAVNAQVIKGRVTTEKGAVVPYAAILGKGLAHRGTMADTSGYFNVTVNKLPCTFVISAVGYIDDTVAVNDKTTTDTLLRVVLLENKALLSDIVVTASDGAIRRPLGFGAVTAVPADIMFNPVNLGSALEGKIAGVQISESRVAVIKVPDVPSSKASGKNFISTDSMALQSSGPQPAIRRLTAGEVNDFNKWVMWEGFTQNEFKKFSEKWDLFTTERYCVLLQNNQHSALPGRQVYLLDKTNGDTVWQAVTDNTGKAELWAGINNGQKENKDYAITCTGCTTNNKPVQFANGINKLTIQAPCFTGNDADIAFVVDATGSMGDEMEFLKIEMENILEKANADFSGVNINAAAVVYRDKGDEYLTKYVDFSSNLLKAQNFIKLQSANAGGDEPEAVDAALRTALDSLQWHKDARTKLLFLVLDAPPHDYAKGEMFRLMKQAAAQGVRIIPIVCSGADKTTEFIMRNLALATNGTYVFLTDDSGIGNSHIKPTTDSYTVELLSDLLPRLIKQMLFVNACSNDDIGVEPVIKSPENTLQLKIAPNPTQGSITIASNKDVKELFVADFTCKILLRVKDGSRNIHLNLSDYPNGIYLIKYITTENEWGADKIVLLH